MNRQQAFNIPLPYCGKCKKPVDRAHVIEHDPRRNTVKVEAFCHGTHMSFTTPAVDLHQYPEATDILFVEYRRVKVEL